MSGGFCIREYDQVESLVFAHCLDHGMAPLTELYQGELIPSRAFADGGIHEAIMAYEDTTFFEILAQELALRDMDDPPITPENYDEVMARMETYLGQRGRMHGSSSYGGSTMLRLKPISLRDANEYVRKYHRHHKPVAGHKFSIGCEADGELVGVIIAGRPVSRYLDDGFTLEVTRLCTNGEKNACSFLYGAAARAAAAMGYKRIITYTLESENGASLRASGWICQGKAGGLRWTGKRQPKEDQYPAQMKLRYEKQLRKEETVNGICSGPEGS